MIIDFTDKAADKVRTLLSGSPDTVGYGLRIGVTPGGCAGYEYNLALSPEPDPADVVETYGGFDVYVSKVMLPMLDGIRIDYVESLTSSGFTFTNPNASGGCGCGNSFAPSASAEQSAADAMLATQIEEAMADIRPYLQNDGGDVRIVGVDDGVVSVELIGACGGCSLATATLSGVIEKRLQEAVPGVRRVALVQ